MPDVMCGDTRRCLPWCAVLWVLLCGGRGAGGQHLAGATVSVTATQGTTAHLPCFAPPLMQTQQREASVVCVCVCVFQATFLFFIL